MTTIVHSGILLYFAVIFCSYWTCVVCGKILLFSGPALSHFREVNGLGLALLDRNHDVHLLISNGIVKQVNEPRYKIITFDADKFTKFDEVKTKNLLISSSASTKIQSMYKNANTVMMPLCNCTVGNKELLDKLKKEKYDLAIINSLSLMICFHLLPDYLNVPHIALGTEIRLSSTRLTEPFIKFFSTDTIMTRFFSYVATILFENIHYIFVDYKSLGKSVDYEYQNVDIMAEKSKLWLLNSDFLLQPPQALPTHVRMVGGLSLQKFKPLEEKFQTFADNAKDGFAVFTFGSQVSYLPHELALNFSKAFELIQPLKIVMRLKGVEVDLFKHLNNVMIDSWLPQNDLMAHKNCKLFISHCGNNGQFEALYHAVPILGFPLFGDQTNNAERIYNRGYGLSYKLSNFSPEDLAKGILELSKDNSSYKLKITAASRIYRRQLPAVQRAADAVEEILQGESQFYYPEPSYKLSAWRYNHLDIFLLTFGGLQILVVLFVFFIFLCFKCVCCRNKAREVKYKTQ